MLRPEATRGGVASGDLGGGWRYVVSFVEKSSSRLNGVDPSFVNDDPAADIGPACGLDFYAIHDALVAMGFVDSRRYGEIGQLRAWHYTRFKKTDGSVETLDALLRNRGLSDASDRAQMERRPGRPGRLFRGLLQAAAHSAESSSACLSTVSVASSCLSGGYL